MCVYAYVRTLIPNHVCVYAYVRTLIPNHVCVYDVYVRTEFEASHGTVADLWHAHLRGEETSLNPLGMVSNNTATATATATPTSVSGTSAAVIIVLAALPAIAIHVRYTRYAHRVHTHIVYIFCTCIVRV